MGADVATLTDRAVIQVAGPDGHGFLQRLVTNDVEGLEPGQARYAALLTPQGKIVTDFLVVAVAGDGGMLLDVPAANAADLVKKLTLYRLRAKVTITDRSQELGIVAFSGALPANAVVTMDDPRAAGLWARAFVERDALPAVDQAALDGYHAARIRAGVPDGGTDFAYGETYPHDANLDHLQGVDFRKGCYVGQEVVSRVQHRGTARKRIVQASFEGTPPAPGSAIDAGGIGLGVMGSAVAGLGLAMVRLDRLAESQAVPEAAGIALQLTPPAWAQS